MSLLVAVSTIGGNAVQQNPAGAISTIRRKGKGNKAIQKPYPAGVGI